MSFIAPPESKARVRAAGKAIGNNTATAEDFALVDQWRASHSYVLNTFKVWFRHKIKASGIEVEFAQRLKRRNTVLDKLRRTKPDGSPLIRDVTTMHDFAGCRLIFNTMDDLAKFRDYLHSSDVMSNVKHRLRHADVDKYNYIERPKPTGYRGIHDVFLHHPRPHRSGSDASGPWQGLMVEVQYRTRAQHAWATAVEITDLVDRQRTKFGSGSDERGQFFAVVSELIARHYEHIQRAFIGLDSENLTDLFFRLDYELSIMSRLDALRQSDSSSALRKHNVLAVMFNADGEYSLHVEHFKNPQDAIARAYELETSEGVENAVYVTGEPKQLRSAYRNYFSDPVDFVGLVWECVYGISSR